MVFAPKANADLGFISDGLKEALLQLSPIDRALVFSRVIESISFGNNCLQYKWPGRRWL